MAQIKRLEPYINDTTDGTWVDMEEYEFGEYVNYWDHVAAMEELQDQIKALSIKQAPY